MKVHFSGDEIEIFDFDELEAYRVARKIEEDGFYYYSRMKEEMLKPEIRQALDSLISEERKHLNLFEEKVEELARKHNVVDEGETLAEIVDSKVMDVLKDPALVADILCTPQEAVRLGISVEKRSILFYDMLLKNTRDETGRAALKEIIREEQRHMKELQKFSRK